MYFGQFPKMVYDIKGDNNYKVVPNIFRRIKVKNRIKNNVPLLDKYSVKDGETPEKIAFDKYGNVQLHWIVLYFNDIVDPFYEWPLTVRDFDKWIIDKYANPNAAHHYEIAQSSGVTTKKVKVESSVVGSTAVSNYDYEQTIQDKKKQIKLLKAQYVPQVVNEFNTALGSL